MKIILNAVLLLVVGGQSFAQQPAQLQAYPNPFADQLNIKLTALEEDTVSLVMYDILGQTVNNFLDNIVISGTATVPYSADSLPAGTYIVVATVNDSVQVKKVVKTATATGMPAAPARGQLTIYPNPAEEVVNIRTDHVIKSVAVYDRAGRLVRAYKNSGGRINVGGWTQGIYHFVITTQNSKKTVRSVVVK